jgi:hypothetical protein
MFRDGRWFWWVVAGCLGVLVADVSAVGPFREPERRPSVEVLGDVVEREPMSSTSTTVLRTTTTLSEDEALEQLRGLDPGTLAELETIRGIDPADLPPARSD